MLTSYDGEVELGGSGYVTSPFHAVIGNVDEPGWLGQLDLAEQVPEATFEPGTVTVILLSGDHNGWCASADIDAAGALRGRTAFTGPT